MHFIYVFNKDAKETLEKMGYKMFQSDDLYETYVFLNDTNINIADSVVYYLLSDSLKL